MVDLTDASLIGDHGFFKLEPISGGKGVRGRIPGTFCGDEEIGELIYHAQIILIGPFRSVRDKPGRSAEGIENKIQVMDMQIKGKHTPY